MTQQNLDNQPNNDDDLKIDFRFRWKMSPALKNAITTATKAGQVTIEAGKILIPWLLMGSMVLHQPDENHTAPQQPDSIEQIAK